MAEEDRQQIRGIMRGLDRMTARAVIKITLDVTANLIEDPNQGSVTGTPIDTGWARNNWVPRIGAPFEGTVGDPGSADGSQQSAGQAQVLGYRVAQGKVFVSNNVPYIERLNEGSSPMQAAGFVQRAIRKAVMEDFAP